MKHKPNFWPHGPQAVGLKPLVWGGGKGGGRINFCFLLRGLVVFVFVSLSCVWEGVWGRGVGGVVVTFGLVW